MLYCLMADLGRQADAQIPRPHSIKTTKEPFNRQIMPNTLYHNQTKHSDNCHHFVCEMVVSNEIQMIDCLAGDMLADIVTKRLANLAFQKLRDLLGMHDITQFYCFQYNIVSSGSVASYTDILWASHAIFLCHECQGNIPCCWFP